MSRENWESGARGPFAKHPNPWPEGSAVVRGSSFPSPNHPGSLPALQAPHLQHVPGEFRDSLPCAPRPAGLPRTGSSSHSLGGARSSPPPRAPWPPDPARPSLLASTPNPVPSGTWLPRWVPGAAHRGPSRRRYGPTVYLRTTVGEGGWRGEGPARPWTPRQRPGPGSRPGRAAASERWAPGRRGRGRQRPAHPPPPSLRARPGGEGPPQPGEEGAVRRERRRRLADPGWPRPRRPR